MHDGYKVAFLKKWGGAKYGFATTSLSGKDNP